MQQYNSSPNTQQMRPRAHMSQDSLWDGLTCTFVVAFLVRIMVSLCELFCYFWMVFGRFLTGYPYIFGSHNGRKGFVDGC